MKNLRILSLLICITLFSCEQISIPPTQTCTHTASFTINENHPKAAQAQEIMDKYIARGIPGINILISDDNGFWIASAGYADLENEIEMKPCHILKLGSVTKMMMGTLVWQLVQDGTLNIHDPISQYIPEVAANIEYGDEITLAMLINHSSGVYDVAGDLGFNLGVINDMTKSWTSDEIIGYLEGKSATHRPGESIRYSNSNTMLISMVIEAATGRQHAELLKERIFDPLGMTSTIYYDYSEDFPEDRLAQGYLDFNNDGGAIQNISNLNPGSGNGFTGVYSTVEDLYRFHQALMRDKSLTNESNLDSIFASFRLVEGGQWQSSIGAIHNEFRNWLDEDTPAYGHAGSDIGYSANLSFFPHNNTIYTATYNYGGNLTSALRETLRSLTKEMLLLSAE